MFTITHSQWSTKFLHTKISSIRLKNLISIRCIELKSLHFQIWYMISWFIIWLKRAELNLIKFMIAVIEYIMSVCQHCLWDYVNLINVNHQVLRIWIINQSLWKLSRMMISRLMFSRLMISRLLHSRMMILVRTTISRSAISVMMISVMRHQRFNEELE